MVKTHTQNVLALSVAALVASGVAAFAGVATFNNDLAGKAVNLAQGEMCPGGCPSNQWCDYVTHSCQAFDYPSSSAYSSTGTASTGVAGASPTTSTTSGPVGLNCAGGTLAACQATCTKDGVVNKFCTGYCAQECPSTSTTTTSTTVTVKNRCADVTEKDGCMAKCTCYIERAASCAGTPKDGEAEFCNAVKGADAAKTGKTGIFNMTTCSNYCDELKAVPLPAPVVEEPAPTAPVAIPAEPVSTRPIIEPEHRAAPVFEDNFEDQEDFDGGDDDFDGFDDENFDMGFGGPEDFGHLGDFYDMDFDPEMMQEGFGEYFGGFGPGMGEEFGGEFGDDFGGMPPWMEDIGKEILGVAREFCPDDVIDEIQMAIDDGNFEEIEPMMMECGGGDMGGGPMQDPSEVIEMFQEMVPAIREGLAVLLQNGFDVERGEKISSLLDEVEEAAGNAEEVCADIGFGGDDDEDFFGLKGFLAQIFDGEEEGDDDEDSDEGIGDPEACRMAIEEMVAFMDNPEDPESDATVRGNMESPTEEFFRSLDKEKGTKSAISVCEKFIGAMEVVVGGGDDSGETPEDMCENMADNDWDIPDDGGPGGEDYEEGDEDDEDEWEDFEDEGEDVESEEENSVDEGDFDF